MIPFAIELIIYLLVDVYCFFGLRSVFTKSNSRLIFTIVYFLVSAFTLYCFYRFTHSDAPGLYNGTGTVYYLGRFMVFFITKIFLAFFLLLQDGSRVIIGLIKWVKTFFNKSTSEKFIPSRRKSLTSEDD